MLLVRNISQLVTMSGPPHARRGEDLARIGMIENAAILVDGEKIHAVGPERDILNRPEAQNAPTLDAKGCAVLPGFCDSHTHPAFAKLRIDEYEMRIKGATYEEIAAAGGGILSSVRAVREAPESELLEVALHHAELFLAHGTTAIEAKSGYGLDLESELKLLRVIREMGRQTPLDVVPTFLGTHQIPAEYKKNREGYIRLICEKMIPAVADEGLAEFCDVFCDTGVFTVAEARRILEAGMRRGLAPKIHADQLTLSGGAALAVDIGAVSADHLEKITLAEIALLAHSGTIATLLPGSVLHLGLHQYAPARALIDGGAAVALATDFNPGSAPSPNMQMTVALACDLMRMTPAEAICAATVNGACAMRRERFVGSIEPGKQADLFISKVPDYRMIPYHFGMNHCAHAVKKGKIA